MSIKQKKLLLDAGYTEEALSQMTTFQANYLAEKIQRQRAEEESKLTVADIVDRLTKFMIKYIAQATACYNAKNYCETLVCIGQAKACEKILASEYGFYAGCDEAYIPALIKLDEMQKAIVELKGE